MRFVLEMTPEEADHVSAFLKEIRKPKMEWVDDWGNEYATREDAINGMIVFLQKDETLYSLITEYFDYSEVLEWMEKTDLTKDFIKDNNEEFRDRLKLRAEECVHKMD